MRERNSLSIKHIAHQPRAIDRALRDILLPLCAAAIVVMIAVFSAAQTPTSPLRFDRSQEDSRDFAFSLLVWYAAASSTDSLP